MPSMLPFLLSSPYLAPMKKRIPYPGAVHRLSQETLDGVLVFYTAEDCLVCFCLFCTLARRHGIQLLALCLLPNQIHSVVRSPGEAELSRFVQQYTHLFVREWNRSRGRKGSLFKPRFLRSIAWEKPQIQSLLNDSCRLPVDRQLALRADDYRWNFLRYAVQKQPFSAPCRLSEKSRPFRSALREARRLREQGGYLHYGQLQRWTKKLPPVERQQLYDYLIGLWNGLDYPAVLRYYGSYPALVEALQGHRGRESNLPREEEPSSDAVYRDCARILLQEGSVETLNEVCQLPRETKLRLAASLRYRTTARPRQIEKFLHLQAD